MNRRSTLTFFCLLAGFALVSIVLFQFAMNYGYSHDEEQYVFASLLAVDLSLYRDFIYTQTPFYPLLLSIVFSFVDEGYFYVSRATTFFLSLGTFCLIFQLGRRITGETLAATAFAVLFLTSEIMPMGFGTARNDMMSCFFAVLGVYMVYEGQSQRRGKKTPLLFFGGVMLAVSVGTKVSYAFVPITVALYCLWPRDDSWSWQFRTVALPLMLGGLVGALPLIYYAWLSFDNFLYDIVGYHSSATAYWYEHYQPGGHMSLPNQIFVGARRLSRDGSTGFCAVFLLFALITVWFRGSLMPVYRHLHASGNLLFIALAVLCIPAAMLIPEGLSQYYIPTVPFMLMGVAAIYVNIRVLIPHVGRHLLVAGTVVVMLPGLGNLVKIAISPSTVKTVQSISRDIRRATHDAGIQGKIATLSPIFVIDAGLPVYKEFAAGPFFFRTGDMLLPQEINSLNGVSPNTLQHFLDNDPPAAIFVGFERNKKFPLDEHLEHYARQRGYVKAEGNFGARHAFLATAAEKLSETVAEIYNTRLELHALACNLSNFMWTLAFAKGGGALVSHQAAEEIGQGRPSLSPLCHFPNG